ncbi:MAG TPA: class I SAM-dependent methyltransferase [Methylomirabilota bacterium]|nr:class I SAM-dependent methyltransferase [Methylomirabilota bacterium]
MAAWLKRLVGHPALRAVLDHPALFSAFRFLLVGRQELTHRLLRTHLTLRPDDQVLDVCCGIGEFAGDVPCAYVGIDLNPRFVAAAARQHAGASGKAFQVMDALAMTFPDKHFTKALFVNGLHHFSDEDARRVLAELRRVTRERVVVIDADGTPRGLIRRVLLAADRGDWMRGHDALTALVRSALPVSAVVPFEVGLYAEVLYECRLD